MRPRNEMRLQFKSIFIILLIITFQLNFIRQTTGQTPRIIIEYAESVSHLDFENSTSLENVAEEVSYRIIVEYAESTISLNSENSSSLSNVADEVDPRIIVEYAESLLNLNLIYPDELYQIMTGPSIIVNTLNGNYYDSAPDLDVDFIDATGLDSAFYKIDSFLPTGTDTSGWTEIFSDHTGTSYTTDFIMDNGVWSSLSDGSHTVYFKAWDDSGYVTDGVSHSWQFNKDTSEPLITINNLDGNYYAFPPLLDIDFYDPAGLDDAYYKVDTFTPTGIDTSGWIEIFSDHTEISYTTDFTMDNSVWYSLSEGSHTVYFKAWDDLGNINDGSLPTWQFNIDLSIPSIILNTPNSSFGSSPLIDIDFFDSSGLDAAYYKVDSYTPLGTDISGWIEIFSNYPGTSYTTDFTMDNTIWSSLSEGPHIVYFKAWDDLGNVQDDTKPSLGFIKDTVFPIITIKTLGGDLYISPPSISVEIYDNLGLDDAYYKVDSYTPTGTDTSGWIEIFNNFGTNNYTSSIQLDTSLWNTLDDGLHTVYFKTWDISGNINDGSIPSWQFSKDSSAPIILINNIDGSPHNSAPILDVDFSDPTGLNAAYYKVDSYTPIGTDTSGWIEIFSDYPGTSYTSDFTMDNGVWTSLSEGSHIVYFKAWDDIGNIIDGPDLSWEFIIDLSEPDIVVNIENDTYYNAPPLIDVDFSDPGGLDAAYYKVDSYIPSGIDTSGWIEVFSDFSGIFYTTDFSMDYNVWTSLSEGSHVVYFKASDEVGNINDGYFPSWQFNIDLTPPNIIIKTPNRKPYSSPPIFNVTFEDSYDLKSAYYKIESYTPMGTDTAGWNQIFIDISGKNHTTEIIISDFIWNALEEGSYNVFIKCWDDLGNVNDGPTPYWHFFKYFGTPIIKVNTPQGNFYNSSPVMDVDFFDPTGLNNAYLKVDSYIPLGTNTTDWIQIFSNQNRVNYTTNFIMTNNIWSTLSEGSHIVYFKVWNYSDSINDGSNPSWQFYKDITPPEISLLSPAQNGIYQSSVTISVDITGHMSCYNHWDDEQYTITTLTTFALPNEDGSHTLNLKAKDEANNIELAAYTFIVDNTPPTAEVVGMRDSLRISNLITIRVKPYDEYGINFVSFYLGSELISKQTTEYIYRFDPTMYPYGTYIFIITIEDLAGNTLSRDFTIYIEEPQQDLWQKLMEEGLLLPVVSGIVLGVIGLIFFLIKRKIKK